MRLKILGSSSKGNCYILESANSSLLLEAGIRWKDIQVGLGFDYRKVAGCLVSHSHLDHAKSVRDVMKNGIEVYTSNGTGASLNLHGLRTWWPIKAGHERKMGDFTVKFFDTQHDAAEPLGFLIKDLISGQKLIFATDTYYIKYMFNKLNYIMVECNYCEDILQYNIDNHKIPESLKNRLLKSHFALNNVKSFLMANDLTYCKKIVLLHLSDGNSNAERMQKEVQELTGIDTVVADEGMVLDLGGCPF
jgi:phosphoribosyl 1,2-cyclic phosphodiesterase